MSQLPPPAGDPITAAYNGVLLLLATADEIGALIGHLQDHQRTLAQAEAYRREQSKRLDGPAEADAPGDGVA